MNWILRARKPTGSAETFRLVTDPDLIRPHLEDAAHFPGGQADALAAASNEAEVTAAIRSARAILPIGAQSSLTGGGSPAGGVVLTTSRMKRLETLAPGSVRVGAGVTLTELDEALASRGAYYPPPTFMGAFVGGTISTNAAGAATFKYGTTRNWVQALTVVLADGDVLDITRGETQAHPDGYFELDVARGRVRIDVPTYQMPRVPKLSAGYFAAPAMDLIDLFIGSEGTLGVITEATLRVIEPRPSFCLVFIPFDDAGGAIGFVRALRDASRQTWASGDPQGVDVSAVEHMDARCLELVREDGADRANGVSIPASARLALLVTLEVGAGTTAERVYAEIAAAGERRGAADSAVTRFLELLARARGVSLEDSAWLEHVHIAVPGDRHRARQLLAIREAVPAAINARIARIQRDVDARIEKTAADVIVPFDRFEELLQLYAREFDRRRLDAAIWGHISDGNVHPNILPRSLAEVESGRDAIMIFGREAIRLGGAPLAEHGVGRSVTKRRLLRELYGDAGIEQMKRVKRALDPEWKLAPGVIF